MSNDTDTPTDTEALARALNPMLGGIIPLDWSVVDGADFLTELAGMILASNWLAARGAEAWEKGFAEGVIAAHGLDALDNPYRQDTP